MKDFLYLVCNISIWKSEYFVRSVRFYGNLDLGLFLPVNDEVMQNLVERLPLVQKDRNMQAIVKSFEIIER